jgi:hypothetical protein
MLEDAGLDLEPQPTALTAAHAMTADDFAFIQTWDLRSASHVAPAAQSRTFLKVRFDGVDERY